MILETMAVVSYVEIGQNSAFLLPRSQWAGRSGGTIATSVLRSNYSMNHRTGHGSMPDTMMRLFVTGSSKDTYL